MSKTKKILIIVGIILLLLIGGIAAVFLSTGKTLSTYKSFDFSNIDISGATYSSNVIKVAVYNALTEPE